MPEDFGENPIAEIRQRHIKRKSVAASRTKPRINFHMVDSRPDSQQINIDLTDGELLNVDLTE